MSPQLGIAYFKVEPNPIFFIHRFKVIERESFHLLEPHVRKRNLNFQINGDSDWEKVVLRIYLDERKSVYKSRFYCRVNMDAELARYLAMALLERLKLKYKFRKDHICKEITKWQ